MTRDELIIHWREVLAVPDDISDARIRQLCRQATAVLLETFAPMADRLGTPRPSFEEQQRREHLEREVAQASLDVAREEARSGIVRPLTAAERAADARLAAAEAKLAELTTRVAVGELIPKADVIQAIDRRFLAVIDAIRADAPTVDMAGWDDGQRERWVAGVIDATLEGPLFRAENTTKQ